jgi:flagellar motor switch protein FliM
MSGDRLNNDQVAALVEAAKQGQLPEQSSGIAQRRGQRLRTVDFSRPTKFTSDHQRRISRAIETFCQTSVTRLSSELRTPIELEPINSTQATWSAAQSQLPSGSLWVTLDVQPIGTRMLFTVEQSFILMCLDCLLGGSPDRPPRERRLSEIDTMLTHRLVESLVHQMSVVWQDLAGISLSITDIDVHNDTSQIAAVSEPTLVIVIESRINKHSASMALLIPWLAIDPVAQRLSGKETRAPGSESAGAAEISRAVAAVPRTSSWPARSPGPTAPGGRSRCPAQRGSSDEPAAGHHSSRSADAARRLHGRGGRAGARDVRAGHRGAR